MKAAKATVLALGALASLSAGPPAAAAVLTVDAREQPPAPETGYLHFGASRSPSGSTIGVNSRYLTLDGRPWLPVMGEFHYTRFPARYWEEELRKMKAAGVSIVSTYIFWNHHEEVEGRFDWTGDRDLRRFVTLCGRLGLKVMIRPGPWVHSEARFGGIPDWVVHAATVRSNDPVYLRYVTRYWGEVAGQLKGLLWKDGGPVIGMQIENEYNISGPGQGREHIAALKRLALAAGFDLPLYTVTGWDNTVYPSGEVTPVFGGYADEPWGLTTEKLAPAETYAFRFDTRVRGNLGAETSSATTGDAETDVAHTPFLGAEFGGGVPTMYRRRPIMAPDDAAAMLPVELGSGANLYGYYMFHGGRNSPGHGSQEENTAIGAYNDLPMVDYDFQAPIGGYGQQHAVLGRIRPFHYFLQAFGPDLAPMSVHRPAVLPHDKADLVTPRFSVRSLGDRGFLFVNNYVRQYAMAAQQGVQFQVQLPDETVTFPARPIDIPSGAYFIWPINMDLAGVQLDYATAQPVTRLEVDGTPVYVFRAVQGVPAEFAFDGKGVAAVSSRSGAVVRDAASGRVTVSDVQAGSGAGIEVETAAGAKVRLLVLTADESERLSVGTVDGRTRLVLTDAQLMFEPSGVDLLSTGAPDFRIEVYPALARAPAADRPLRQGAPDGVFQVFEAHAPSRSIEARIAKIREARPVPPLAMTGPGGTAVEPTPETFGKSAAWSIRLPPGALTGVDDAFLRIQARGDVGRLFAGMTMIDDHFLDGRVWEVGLKRFAAEIRAPLMLTVLPMRRDAPIYLDGGVASMVDGDQTAEVTAVSVAPQYRLRIRVGAAHRAPARASRPEGKG
jgi:hypothetical protein